MFKVKNVKIQNIRKGTFCFFEDIKFSIEKILSCQNLEDFKEFNYAFLNKTTINEEFLKKLEKEGEAELNINNYVASCCVGAVKFLVVKEN